MIRVAVKKISKEDATSTRRQAETAAVKACLEYLGFDAALIDHYPSGRPFIKGQEETGISISHSSEWAVVAVGEKEDGPFGVDVENCFRTRLDSVVGRIMNARETRQLDNEEYIKVWTAKEAAYKAFYEDKINIRNDIDVDCARFETVRFVPTGKFLRLSFVPIGADNLLCVASECNKFDLNTL